MRKKVGYLGPKGTYSELAAIELSGDAELVNFSCFPEVFKALAEGRTDAAVIPIENTVNGAVTQNLDLMQEYDKIFAIASYDNRIDHRLVTMKGADMGKIKRIYSHAQALGQCSQYLSKNFPAAQLIATSSTADSLMRITCPEEAGIVGVHCKKDGFEISDFNISDDKNNYTTFLLVVRGQPEEALMLRGEYSGAAKTRSDRVFFSVTCRHEVGGLLNILKILSDHGINLTEIESRPIKERHGEFRFFMETEGDMHAPDVADALRALGEKALSFKLLGCY